MLWYTLFSSNDFDVFYMSSITSSQQQVINYTHCTTRYIGGQFVLLSLETSVCNNQFHCITELQYPLTICISLSKSHIRHELHHTHLHLYQRDHSDTSNNNSDAGMLSVTLIIWSQKESFSSALVWGAYAQIQVTNLSLINTFKHIMRSFTLFTSIILLIHLSEMSNPTPALTSLQPCQKTYTLTCPYPSL